MKLTLRKPDRLALLSAASLMTDRAWVVVDGATVTLTPRRGAGRGLKRAFLEAYEDQKRHWTIARANLDVRSAVLARSLEPEAREAVEERLPPEQARRIAELLAEAETEPWDPLGISRPWEESR